MPQLTTHPALSSIVKVMNVYAFAGIETISPCPVPFITGDNSHSKEFREDAYKRTAEPKELLIVPGAGHVDLYDRVNLIPIDKLTAFFREHLKSGQSGKTLNATSKQADKAKESNMEIKRAGSQSSVKGPEDWFTGNVRIDPLFDAPAPGRIGGASVTFEPGARTAWHTHPLGQTLIITAGCGSTLGRPS